MSEISIDRDLCMGSGQCLFHAPATFDLDDDDVAVVIDPEGDPEPVVATAAQECPAQAIRVTVR